VARTDTEIYRRFRGTVSDAEPRSFSVARAGLATAFRNKLALVILFAPPAIATVIFSFVVYARFSLEAGATPSALGGPSPAGAIAAGFARTLIRVRDQIVLFHITMSYFTLLVISWYGAGLIAEDRRAGAHLLYFSRPLTRSGYLTGKFLTLLLFALVSVLVPSLVICTVATFASPEWSFLKEEGRVVPASIGFACLWAGVWSSVMLAISSLSSSRTFALVASFAFFAVTSAIAALLVALERDPAYLMLSLQGHFHRIAVWMFDLRRHELAWDVRWSFGTLLGVVLAAWAILFHRVRRMEGSS
jgi:ABC-type transport system involved in multi-copper enzyme maturation permease subunit